MQIGLFYFYNVKIKPIYHLLSGIVFILIALYLLIWQPVIHGLMGLGLNNPTLIFAGVMAVWGMFRLFNAYILFQKVKRKNNA
jgi:hypothetical protein